MRLVKRTLRCVAATDTGRLRGKICRLCIILLTPVVGRDSFSGMKLITTIVRPERLPEVKAALFRAGVTGISLSRVSGHGGEQEVLEQYRGTTVVMEFHEKVKIEMAVSEPFVEPTINAIVSAARTGEVGDGKIFVQALERVIRIRTGELDNAALTAVNADEVQRVALETAERSGAPVEGET
jgi:nitrogen regulatory protein P-II 1